MISKYLFPNYFKKAGWVLIIVSILWPSLIAYLDLMPQLRTKVVSIYSSYGKEKPGSNSLEQNWYYDSKKGKNVYGIVHARRHWFIINDRNLFFPGISFLFIIGAIFVSFSKQKTEDEFMSRMRLDSLFWATSLNYFLLLFSMLLLDVPFSFVLFLNQFTILIFFLVRFNFVVYKSKKIAKNEK